MPNCVHRHEVDVCGLPLTSLAAVAVFSAERAIRGRLTTFVCQPTVTFDPIYKN